LIIVDVWKLQPRLDRLPGEAVDKDDKPLHWLLRVRDVHGPAELVYSDGCMRSKSVCHTRMLATIGRRVTDFVSRRPYRMQGGHSCPAR
jgi:hypothetical protein